ncbi:type II toxin-antitoxin system prevent-host-death family antitoxin [Notoacmeibacter sp. MSK16QG-6]|uniref:type II toxin-antitoxin system prevent-host-death family antitoxin n=1 Tax=Notoacmeibacter sp. MSK16QG-6 TaxID=2957982 RepID=UPI00209F7096|nr:type II toxin-antitoxin system prevent-host-death family antitoxin [Notoacmeibacter sp. MSK16QG-6]MCP1200992.1 type II toxin-antitoxin system prevent-host-death family antitoxin [Notoacmeibacter sp. MSK16QG-6]
MKQYTFSDMNRSSGEILETAMVEPVVLTKHGKEKLFVLSARDYHRLRGEPSPTKAYSLHDAPDEVREELMSGIDSILEPAKDDA